MIALVYDNNPKVKVQAVDFFIKNFNKFPESKKKIFAESVVPDIVTNSNQAVRELISFNILNLLSNLEQ